MSARTKVRSAAAPKDTGTLDLALRILDHLAEQASPIALTAIAQTFAASKSTVYRHLSALARHGFVRRDVSTGRYAIGIKLMVLGETSRSNFEIVTVARDALLKLRDTTGQAVSLCALLDDDLVVLDLMHGRSVVEFTTRPGTRLALHASAHGKIWLAFGPEGSAQEGAERAAAGMDIAHDHRCKGPPQRGAGGAQARLVDRAEPGRHGRQHARRSGVRSSRRTGRIDRVCRLDAGHRGKARAGAARRGARCRPQRVARSWLEGMTVTYSLAVDIGGTFTDIVLRHSSGVLTVDKVLTTHHDLLEGFFAGVSNVMKAARIGPRDVDGVVVHATTIVTNALIERKGRPTALLVTEGFRDILHIRNEHRYEMYDPQIEFPDPLVPSELTFGVAERVRADGTILRAPDDEAGRGAGRQAQGQGRCLARHLLSQQLRQPGQRARGRQAACRAAAGCVPDAVIGRCAADPRISARLDRGRQRLHDADLAALSAGPERAPQARGLSRIRR